MKFDKLLFVILLLVSALIITRLLKESFTSQKADPDVVQKVYDLYDTRFKNRFYMNNKTGKLDSVDMVYAIVMPQRKEYMSEQINSLGLKCKYLNAVTPDDFTYEEMGYLSSVNTPGSSLYNLKTRLAVMFSFTMCYIDALKNGYSTFIVFEDDIVIDVDLQTLNAATTKPSSLTVVPATSNATNLIAEEFTLSPLWFLQQWQAPKCFRGHQGQLRK
jgi:hypothetical protein